MKKLVYVLKYLDGRFVQRDDSTGPMASGGYPYPVDTINEATKWDEAVQAAQYAQVSNWREMYPQVFPLEIVYRDLDPISFPYKGDWSECNRHCLRTPESTAPEAMHFLDCPIMKKD